jgi:hypothetical protein
MRHQKFSVYEVNISLHTAEAMAERVQKWALVEVVIVGMRAREGRDLRESAQREERQQ